jgi:hypothetical protein
MKWTAYTRDESGIPAIEGPALQQSASKDDALQQAWELIDGRGDRSLFQATVGLIKKSRTGQSRAPLLNQKPSVTLVSLAWGNPLACAVGYGNICRPIGLKAKR